MRLEDVVDVDDRGVSPVIGVILMIAITVILAAVIASFVLGLNPGNTAPQASFSGDYDSGTGQLTITLDSANDDLTASNYRLSGPNNAIDWEDVDSGWVSSSVISAGSSITVDEGSTDDTLTFSEGDTIEIIYTGGSGSKVVQEIEV